MLKKSSRVNKAFFLMLAGVLLVSGLACGSDEEMPGRANISIHKLRSNPSNYVGRSVVIKGFLSRAFSSTGGPIVLYATRDDAEMRNIPSSVFIDLHNNERLVDINNCLERFVEVAGTFRDTDDPYAGGGLGIADVEWLKIITEPTSELKSPSQDESYCVLLPGVQLDQG